MSGPSRKWNGGEKRNRLESNPPDGFFSMTETKNGVAAPLRFSNLVPADLVGIQVQGERASVPTVNGGGLRLVGVIDHALFAVLAIGLDLHVIIGGNV